MKRTVTRVIDGDTFEVRTRIGDTRFVRLAGVNAPELNQQGGIAAMNRLKNLVGGRTVTIVPVGRSYNRIVANVRHQRKSINKRII